MFSWKSKYMSKIIYLKLHLKYLDLIMPNHQQQWQLNILFPALNSVLGEKSVKHYIISVNLNLPDTPNTSKKVLHGVHAIMVVI